MNLGSNGSSSDYLVAFCDEDTCVQLPRAELNLCGPDWDPHGLGDVLWNMELFLSVI